MGADKGDFPKSRYRRKRKNLRPGTRQGTQGRRVPIQRRGNRRISRSIRQRWRWPARPIRIHANVVMASSTVCFLNNEVIGIFSSSSSSSSSSSFFLPHGIVIYHRRLSFFLIITCFL